MRMVDLRIGILVYNATSGCRYVVEGYALNTLNEVVIRCRSLIPLEDSLEGSKGYIRHIHPSSLELLTHYWE